MRNFWGRLSRASDGDGTRAQVLGTALVHEFNIFYSHTEWNWLVSIFWDRFCFGWGVLLK